MDIKNEQYQSICRTCLIEKENMNNIYDVADILMICAPIQIEQGDGLPSTICSECMNLLNQAYEFRMLCEQSENVLRIKQLKQHVNLKQSESTNVLEHVKKDEELSVPDSEKGFCEETKEKIVHRKSRRKSTKKDLITDTKQIENQNESDSLSNLSDASDNEEENETELSCKYCDMKFRYKIRLKKHEQKHLRGLKCHLCEKDFSTIKQLTNHINIHSRKGAHLCQTCGKQFTLPENLVRHQRIHNGIRPYKCQLCNKSFTQSNELKSHLITHSSEKHHLCSVCGNKYSRSISLRVHMRRIHSIPPNDRPYICAICGRNFKDRRDLSQHMLIHTGERSHVCAVCGKAFNRSSNLRVHERIHSGHKPHVCPICQRAFIQKHVLITHMRTHPHYSNLTLNT